MLKKCVRRLSNIKQRIKNDLTFDLSLAEEDFAIDAMDFADGVESHELPVNSVSGEQLAKLFYDNYQHLLPQTKEPGPPWGEISEANRLHLVRTSEKVLEQLFDVKIDIDEKYPDDLMIDLIPVKNFFDEYVGAIIADYSAFADDVEDLAEDICPAVIDSTSIKGNALYIKLSEVNGGFKGYLRLEPTREGEFAQRYSEDEEIWASRYRILLYGGSAIEYLDSNLEGTALFVDNQKENT